MKAIILAAGYATRLYPLTQNQPKCLLEVAGRTILDSICLKLDAVKELNEIVIVTNAKFYDQLTAWSKNAKLRSKITVLNDGTTSNDNRLGASGDLQFAVKNAKINDDILYLASDNLFEQGLQGFVDFAHSKKGAMTVALYDLGDPKLASKKFGVLEIDANNQVVGLEEKPEFPKTSLIGMGIYFLPKELLGKIDDYLKTPGAQDAPGFFVAWMLKTTKIFGVPFKGLWYDIGNLEALKEANRIFAGQNA